MPQELRLWHKDRCSGPLTEPEAPHLLVLTASVQGVGSGLSLVESTLALQEELLSKNFHRRRTKN